MQALAAINLNQLLNGPAVPVILTFFTVGVVAVIWIIASQWRRVRVAESEAALKVRLVERGYSIDDIERVLQTRLESAPRRRKVWRKRAKNCCSSDFLT